MTFAGFEAMEVMASEIERVMEEGSFYRLLRLRTGKIILEITPLSRLSLAERSLLNEAFQQYPIQSRSKTASTPTFLKWVAKQDDCILTLPQIQRLSEVLDHGLLGIGPFSYLIEIPHLEEIALSGLGEFAPIRVYHQDYGWVSTNLFVCDETVIHHWVNQLAKPSGRRVTWQQPRVNAILSNGSRLHACFPPLSTQPSVTIRRFRPQPFGWADFIRMGFLNEQIAAWLHLAMQCQFSVLVVGNTGSGKTSLLNALMQGIPIKERMICLEEVPELTIPHAHCVRLVSNPEMNVTLSDLVIDSLRMRPDRIIMGEIRSPDESRAFCETLFSGQGKGSLATFHGQSTTDALERLREHGVSSSAFGALDLIVTVKRQSILRQDNWQEIRRVTHVAAHNGKGSFETILEWNPKTDKWLQKKTPPHLANRLQRVFGNEPVESILNRVRKWVLTGYAQNWSHQQFFFRQDDWRKTCDILSVE